MLLSERKSYMLYSDVKDINLFIQIHETNIGFSSFHVTEHNIAPKTRGEGKRIPNVLCVKILFLSQPHDFLRHASGPVTFALIL